MNSVQKSKNFKKNPIPARRANWAPLFKENRQPERFPVHFPKLIAFSIMAELRGKRGLENTERSSDDQRISEISFEFTVIEFNRKNKRPIKILRMKVTFNLPQPAFLLSC